MVETETGEATPCLETCSCQQEIFLFASDPVWTLYLPYCELLKSHSLLTFYKPQSCSTLDVGRFSAFCSSLEAFLKQQSPTTGCCLRWDRRLDLRTVVEGKLQTGLERLGGSLPFQAETMVWVLS